MNDWKAAGRIAVLFCLGSPCLADVALIVAEPYGRAGAWALFGHAAIYLTRACADTPTRLRRCNPDEPGVVISRYGHVAGFDWLALPLVPYLYAVDRVEDIPDISDSAMVVRLREHYRREHLSSIVSDDRARPTPKGNWIQLVGASYDRKLYFFQIETTAEQDEALIAELNQGANQGRFNLFFRNCADFARDVINHYYPKAVRRNFVADLGMENVMPRRLHSKQPRSRTLRSNKSQSTDPLDCPNNLSLYEWESRIAEERLAAQRKSKKKRKRF